MEQLDLDALRKRFGKDVTITLVIEKAAAPQNQQPSDEPLQLQQQQTKAEENMLRIVPNDSQVPEIVQVMRLNCADGSISKLNPGNVGQAGDGKIVKTDEGNILKNDESGTSGGIAGPAPLALQRIDPMQISAFNVSSASVAAAKAIEYNEKLVTFVLALHQHIQRLEEEKAGTQAANGKLMKPIEGPESCGPQSNGLEAKGVVANGLESDYPESFGAQTNVPELGAVKQGAEGGFSSSLDDQAGPTSSNQFCEEPLGKYEQLTAVLDEIRGDVLPACAGSRGAMERLKRKISHARGLVCECRKELGPING